MMLTGLQTSIAERCVLESEWMKLQLDNKQLVPTEKGNADLNKKRAGQVGCFA